MEIRQKVCFITNKSRSPF